MHHYNKVCECQTCRQTRAQTITDLVQLVDILRQPYNNSKRYDLYLKATKFLNDLEDKDIIP